MSIYGDRAEQAFYSGCNCSQSAVLPFAEEIGMTRDQVLKLVGGLGGGVGRMREVCGALTGITLVLGALYGFTDPKDKSAFYAEVQALAREFCARNGKGTLICRELLGLEKAEGTPVAEERTAEYYQKRPCPMLVRVAADVMAEYMAAHPLPRTGGAQAGPPAQEPAAR